MMRAAYAGSPATLPNRSNLRVVETVYRVEPLNEAQEGGAICLVKHKEFNPALNISALLLRHRETGEYVVAAERKVFQQYGRSPLVYSEDEWELVQTIEGYARPIRHESNWGAYILPPNVKVGERLYIRELIEDLVASEFWGSISPAETAEAVWDGTNLVIDHSSYRLHLVG